jgi:hypothetical protein
MRAGAQVASHWREREVRTGAHVGFYIERKDHGNPVNSARGLGKREISEGMLSELLRL